MVSDSPFKDTFANPFIDNVITSYHFDFLNHGDKNCREGNLLNEALAYYLEEKTGKILMPVQNIFWTTEQEIKFNIWKHQVVAIYGIKNEGDQVFINKNKFDLNPNAIVYGQKNDTIEIHKSEKKSESLYLIYNFIFKYFNEANQ